MKLYKFRSLGSCDDLKKIKDIFENGFYCNNFLNFNDMNEAVFSVNPKNKKIELSGEQRYKICSFSGKNALNKELMWGHYANAGMGIVIEVDINNCKNIEEVTYSNSHENLNSIKEILTHKSEEWRYENEFRCIIENHNKKGAIKRKIGEITKIYFGTPYQRLENYDEIKEKHKKLKEYLKYKQKLEYFCSNYSQIDCYDHKFEFNKANNTQ